MTEEQRAELEKLAKELDRLAECEGGVRGGSPRAAMTMTCSAIGIRSLLATIARLEAEKVKDGERADRWRDACEAKDGQLCEIRAEVRRLSSRSGGAK